MKPWQAKKIKESRDRAVKESGRQEGMAEAYKEVLELNDPNKYCLACGYQWWDTKAKESHFEQNPEHKSQQETE